MILKKRLVELKEIILMAFTLPVLLNMTNVTFNILKFDKYFFFVFISLKRQNVCLLQCSFISITNLKSISINVYRLCRVCLCIYQRIKKRTNRKIRHANCLKQFSTVNVLLLV